MPTPLAKGIIIAVSVIAAAGVAAYESPQVQEWLRQSRQKIAMALHSLGDDIQPHSSSPRSDVSMHEDTSDEAEARRRQARAEILERARMMQGMKRQRRSTNGRQTKRGSFDTLVDQDGILRKDQDDPIAQSSAIDTSESQTLFGRRNGNTPDPLHQSVDSPIAHRQLGTRPEPPKSLPDPFENTYEQEMRNTWSMPLSPAQNPLSSHASESLVDYTPTSEVPDPDFSVPDSTHLTHPLDRSEYFSANASASSHTLSREENDYYYAHPENPFQPLPPQNTRPVQLEMPSVSSAPSIAGSMDRIGASDFDESSDGVLSDFGDGVRTPASAWTEVDSVVGSEAGH